MNGVQLSQKELQTTMYASHNHDLNRPRQISVSESDYDSHALDSASMSLVETMRRDLATAQDTINSLTSQNAELRGRLIEQSHVANAAGGDKQVHSLL